MPALTIQQVAQQTGLSVHTLRYYERNGLLEPVNRASSGHRRYLEDDVARIEFLTRLRATGMPIRQMQEFAQLFRERPEAIADRRAILEAHKQQVQAHIQELQRNLDVIDWKINYYKQLESQQPTHSETDAPQDCVTAAHPHMAEHIVSQTGTDAAPQREALSSLP
jgi:DNA-binding transcriptional MerR regulator